MVNLGYDIMRAGVVSLSSFLITQCAMIEIRGGRDGHGIAREGAGRNVPPAPGTESVDTGMMKLEGSKGLDPGVLGGMCGSHCVSNTLTESSTVCSHHPAKTQRHTDC